MKGKGFGTALGVFIDCDGARFKMLYSSHIIRAWNGRKGSCDHQLWDKAMKELEKYYKIGYAIDHNLISRVLGGVLKTQGK